MKLSKKLASIGLAVAMVASIGATSVFATSPTYSSSGNTFDKAWESYASGGDWSMVYGYNTFLIKEDYTHTKHNSKNHTAIVVNDKGSYSKNASSLSWAKIEVTHNGSYITYSISY